MSARLRDAAYAAVWRARQQKVLRRPKNCSACGSEEKIQAHHADYSKPLDVEWLCYVCHLARHWKSPTGVKSHNLTMRLSDEDRALVAQVQERFGDCSISAAVRKLIRDAHDQLIHKEKTHA